MRLTSAFLEDYRLAGRPPIQLERVLAVGRAFLTVSLTSDDGEYRLVVEDDGRGFEFEGRLSARELDRRRIGPAIIKERARIAGAQLVVDSTPGDGARVELSFTEELEHA